MLCCSSPGVKINTRRRRSGLARESWAWHLPRPFPGWYHCYSLNSTASSCPSSRASSTSTPSSLPFFLLTRLSVDDGCSSPISSTKWQYDISRLLDLVVRISRNYILYSSRTRNRRFGAASRPSPSPATHTSTYHPHHVLRLRQHLRYVFGPKRAQFAAYITPHAAPEFLPFPSAVTGELLLIVPVDRGKLSGSARCPVEKEKPQSGAKTADDPPSRLDGRRGICRPIRQGLDAQDPQAEAEDCCRRRRGDLRLGWQYVSPASSLPFKQPFLSFFFFLFLAN